MESAIRLHCCPLLSPPSLRLSYGSKGSEGARGSTLRLRFNHATLCLSHFNNTSHPVARSFRHANCMHNSFFSVPSKNEGSSDNKILRGVTGGSLVLACIFGLFNFSSKMNPKFNTAYAAYGPPSMSGGDVALGSLLQMINSEAAENSGYNAPFDAVKVRPIRPNRSGEKGEAIEKLKKKYAEIGNDESEEKRILRKALVELLIIQGNYKEALDLLDEQIHQRHQLPKTLKCEDKIVKLLKSYNEEVMKYEKVQIAQILLHKAIAHTMIQKDEAAKWWNAFTKTLP